MMRKRADNRPVTPRDFNAIRIYPATGTLVKASEHTETLNTEKEWYRQLPKELSFLHPRIYDLEQPGSIVMEYLDYPTAHQLYMEGKTEPRQWLHTFLTTKAIMDTLSTERFCKEIDEAESFELIQSMYVRKTEERLNQLAEDSIFEPMFQHDVEINGRKYISIGEMINTVRNASSWAIMPIKKIPIIHGDLHLANMLISSGGDGVKLIDPRGKFGGHVLHGDSRYDIAKLMHSIDGGYDMMIEDAFTVKHDAQRRSIRYRFDRESRNLKAEWAFAQVFGERISEDRLSLTVIEALLFLSMIPLHTESRNRQLVMLARGYELMEKALGSVYVRA